MDRREKSRLITIALMTAIISFALLIGGIVGVLSSPIKASMIFGFFIVALAFGSIAALFLVFKPNTGFYVYIAGIVIGFTQMFWTFYNDMGGWGDLIGLISLFFWVAAGLVSGALIQLVTHFYKTYKTK